MKTEKSCGAVLFTEINDKRYYVLVSAGNDINCGFPKGHVEPNETEQDTVLREIWEETCVKAEIINGFRTQIEYILPDGVTNKQVVFYLARFENQEAKTNPEENLDVILLPFDEALHALTFDDTKKVLIEADNWMKNFYCSLQ